MLKSKKFWSYEVSQTFELKQEILDSYKQKGRVYEDFYYFYELMGIGTHPCLKQPYGKEHTEPNAISFINKTVDINTQKILFTILPNTKIVTLKFSNNYFDLNNLEFLINCLINKPNNIFNFVFEWNSQFEAGGMKYNLSDLLVKNTIDNNYLSNILKYQQLICKITTSPKIEALCLRGNFISDDGAIMLFESLRNNNALKVINLFKNNLTSKCIKAFCSMLETNKKLEEINLGNNYLTDDDFALFKNYVGKIPMTHEQVEAHNQKVKARDLILEKNKKLKIQKKPEEHVPVLEEVAQIGETFYVIKNSNLKNLNLMQNFVYRKLLRLINLCTRCK